MTPSLDEREQHLNKIILTLVQTLEKGQLPDRNQVLADHAEFAAELGDFFAGRDRLERLAAPLREAGRAGSFSDRVADGWGGRAGALRETYFPQGSNSGPSTEGSAASALELVSLGDFRVLREVGRGGMGIVYEAEQISLKRRVALKVLPFATGLDPRQLHRFKNEAQAAALLHHPNIVPVYAVGSERGVHFYAMQFIAGQSLSRLIQELRPLTGPKGRALPKTTLGPALADQATPTDARHTDPESTSREPPAMEVPGPVKSSVVQQTGCSPRRADSFRHMAVLIQSAAEALDYAHQLGVIHRDIKPANFLLDGRGTLWITDFGLALLQNQAGLTTTGELVGTLRYMSPEQASARRGLVDHRTDIYSLGVTLYELLTLEPLFESTDGPHLLHQVAFEEPRPPRALDRAIPSELETIVLKAIAKNPADRYSTAQELADDLGRFLKDQPIRARRPSLLDRAVKWSRRHRPLVGSALVLLLLVLGGLLVSTVLIARANRKVNDAYGKLNDAYKLEQQKSEEAQQQRARAEANFTQARGAVDFLTQVSSQELVDKPEVLEVRRKLLQGALQYYQDFIDQHQGDTAIQNELAASRGQVNQILKDLAAQQEYLRLMLRTMLLEERRVQEDLRISSSQQDRIKNLSDRLNRQRGEAFRMMANLPEKERGRKFEEMATANEQAVAAILTPPQATRLSQIDLQQRGPEAFREPRVTEALLLTESQKTHIGSLLDQAQHTLKEGFRVGMNPPEADHKSQEIGLQTREQILALLTLAQRSSWDEMTGKPFQGRFHFYSPFGFGPPGPGHFGPPGPDHPGPPGPDHGPHPPGPREDHPRDGPQKFWGPGAPNFPQ